MNRFPYFLALLFSSLAVRAAPAQLPPLPVSLHEDAPEVGSDLGWAVAAGDIDGDGFDDAVVGAPHADVAGQIDAGRVLVRFGPGFVHSVTLVQPVAQLTSDFGAAVACLDLNGDGLDDVAVGSPDETVNLVGDVGRVYVFFGPDLATHTTIDMPAPEPFSDFGRALAVADLDGDGRDDLLVAAPEATVGGVRAGKVFAISGATLAPIATFAHPAPITGAQLGWSLAAADFDADGSIDVAAAAPNQTVAGLVEAGAAYVWFGPTFSQQLAVNEPVPELSAEFGRSAAAADFDGDGFADLAIGVTDAHAGLLPDAGEVVVLRGPSFANSLVLTEPVPQAGADFGSALAAADVDGDGLADLLVGAEDASNESPSATEDDAGEAFLFFGPIPGPVLEVDPDPVHTDDDFGFSAAFGDFNADGRPDPLVGAKEGEVSGVLDEGRAFVVFQQETLGLDAVTISASAGGLVTLSLDAGPTDASTPYGLLGSILGPSPGFPIGSVVVPATPDPVATPLLFQIVPGSLGTFDAFGHATAFFGMPPGVLPPSSVGISLTFAWVTTDHFDRASSPASFQIAP